MSEVPSTLPTPEPYLTTLATKVREADVDIAEDGVQTAYLEGFNAGRDAVLQAARVTRNPLAGVLSGEDRQVLIALFNAAHDSATNVDRKNRITRVAHKLGLQNDA